MPLIALLTSHLPSCRDEGTSDSELPLFAEALHDP